MQLSKVFLTQIRDDVRDNPLKTDEFRRVEGAGNLYVSSTETKLDIGTHAFLYTLKIDDILYQFTRKKRVADVV